MASMIDNLLSVHIYVWAFAALVGTLIGVFMSTRGVGFGTRILVLAVISWSMFIGLIPIVNHAISPDGLNGIFAGRGIGQFLEDAAPQAIFNETREHMFEVIQSALVGAVLFGAIGLLAATVFGKEDYYDN